MPLKQRFMQSSFAVKLFLGLLAVVYVVYLAVHFVYPAASVVDHPLDANFIVASHHWTASSMQNAVGADEQVGNGSDLTQQSTDTTTAGKAAQQQGQPPANGSPFDHISTVGKVFMTNASGQDMVCSGTAVISANQSVVDTAGHCLYWNGSWVKNVIFCPQYDRGNTPYGCWAARDLEVPADWINARNDFHHDMGMAIVAPNNQGTLTDIVGGAGWAYNQPIVQSYYAYGYPAASPYDGQTRQSCEGGTGKGWQHGGGMVVSIPCGMTGGSSGGPWFVQIGGNWYLDGHNDFTSSMQYGHMFSPYYDDTWYTLYQKAQQA